MSLILLLWLSVVVWLSYRHVPWGDEVRALSLALKGHNLTGMFEASAPEGHPLLWLVLLRAAFGLWSNPAVLKIVSVAVAACAVGIFLFQAPFPLWFRCLFIFSGLPLFEYSVMARNYGISMLLMFAFAAYYTGKRRRPLVLGGILFLLANTNVHSVLFTGLFVALWAWDALPRWSNQPTKGRAALAAGMALAAAGMLFCFLTVKRASASIAIEHPQVTPLQAFSGVIIKTGVRFEHIAAIAGASRLAGDSSPLAAFVDRFAPLLVYLLLLGAIAGLTRVPMLAAAALLSLWGLCLIFMFIYSGGYRHQGLWLVFVLTLYWLLEARNGAIRQRPFTARLRRLSIYGALPLLLLLNVADGAYAAVREARWPYSSSRQAGKILHDRSDLRQAIVMGEGEHIVEALGYYVSNDFYYPRLSRFDRLDNLTLQQKLCMSLGELLACARRLHNETNRPIVILLEPELNRPAGELREEYGVFFTWNANEVADFRQATRKLASLRGSVVERYDVYVLN